MQGTIGAGQCEKKIMSGFLLFFNFLYYLFLCFRSILTGLFPTSSGTIIVYDKDIRTDQEVIRKNMGICMQHNVLFNYLTTKEHLLLYGYIKVPHWSKEELYQEVKRYKNSRVGEG